MTPSSQPSVPELFPEMAPKRRSRSAGPRGPRRWNPEGRTAEQREAGAELMRLLLTWYASCKITAQQFCVACHYCEKAAVKGAAFDMYGFGIGKQSGAYQKHLDTILPQPGPLYEIATPVNSNYSPIRTTSRIPMRYAWQCIDDELDRNSAIIETLEGDPDLRETCVLDVPAYKEHPLVQEAVSNGERLPVPVGVYLDGIRYISQAAGRSDSVLGIWLINLMSGKRHLMTSLRKSDQCSCGCRGYDSLFPLLSALAWMLKAMARGETPLERHDGSAWEEGSDFEHQQRLNTKSVLVWIKGDLMEHATSLGLAPYSTYFNPCSFCQCVSSEMHSFYDDLSNPEGAAWILREDADYEEVCRSREREVQVNSEADKQTLTQAMMWLKGDKGRGRTVMRRVVINGTALEVGDRLDPSKYLLDPGKLSSIQVPATLVFWRPTFSPAPSNLPLDSVVHRTRVCNVRLC